MRVSRLEIFGFKSFMDRLVLPLEGGITGVVGPNGCGKSNVVDAIRWVLGETKASALRGAVLEDVIFNGTDKLRPLGLAEVTLTVRASRENLLAEIPNSGVIEEEPESIATTEDHEETKKPRLTVIRGRKDSTDNGESPQKATYPWLANCSEVQITRRTYRSGDSEYFINRVPCRLKDIKDLSRALGLGARSYTIVAQGEISRVVSAKAEERRTILEEAAGVTGLRQKIAETLRRLSETEINVSRLDDVIREIDRQVTQLKRQAERAKNRQELKTEIETLEKSLFLDSLHLIEERRKAAQEKLDHARSEEGRGDAHFQRLRAEEDRLRAEVLELDIAGDSVRFKLDALKEELFSREKARSDGKSKLSELSGFARAREEEIKECEDRIARTSSRKTECAEEVGRLRREDSDLTDRIRGEDSSGRSQLEEVENKLISSRSTLDKKESVLLEKRDEVVALEKSIEALTMSIEGLSPIKSLEHAVENDSSLRDLKMIGQGLTILPHLSRAVDAALAERAAFLVTEKPYQLSEIFAREYEKNSSLIALGAVHSSAPSLQNDTAPFPKLLSLLKFSEEFEGAAERLLGDVYLAPSCSEGRQFFESNPNSAVRIVTLQGELLSKDSYYAFRHESGVVLLTQKRDELSSQLDLRRTEAVRCKEEKELIVGEISELEAVKKRLQDESEARHARIRDLTNLQGNVRGRLQAELKVLEQLINDLEREAANRKNLGETLRSLRDEESRLRDEVTALFQTADESIREELSILTAEYSSAEELRREKRNRLEQAASESFAARDSLDRARLSVSDSSLESQRIELESSNLRERISEVLGSFALPSLLETLESGAWEKLSVEVREEREESLLRLRNRLVREGDVDPESIERYDQERARLDDLTLQRGDLVSAAKTLKETAESLTQTAKEQFVKTFHAVEKNFSELVTRLFGGGKGSLTLVDPDNPLDSGVEINVRPPGKKPKSIEILSGGEKALCATALIFAMFIERPSPLCVLDEVDAPLDDANLVRFLSLVKEMSTRTQFIMITHNKNSMSASDSLVGVTMQEPGASKVLTVSLQEAYSQVA